MDDIRTENFTTCFLILVPLIALQVYSLKKSVPVIKQVGFGDAIYPKKQDIQGVSVSSHFQTPEE